MVKDVNEADFQQQVIERSKELPVVVDFWAEWCGPCRTLGPAIESAVSSREGKVELAKVDVDSNQQLAAAFRVQGIPAVKAFRDGQVVDEFTGALPPAQIDAFLDRIVPTEADELMRAAVDSGDETALRAVLAEDPGSLEATAALARILLSRGDTDEAAELTAPLASADLTIDGLNARARLSRPDVTASGPADAFESWDRGEHEAALDALLDQVESADPDRRDQLRRVMVGWFTELGPTSELASSRRRRLARTIN
jgi:putative thioredoxin